MAKRVLAVIMVASMLLALTACQTPSSTPAPVTSAPSTETLAPEASKTPELEPITFKFWTAAGATGTSGIQNNVIMNELAKRTGITLDVQYNIQPDQYSAMVASGDLPDLMTTEITAQNNSGTIGVKTYVQGDNMVDMEPLLAEHGKDILLDSDKVEFGKEFLSNGTGKLYFIPSWGLGHSAPLQKTFNNGLGIGIYLRWDVYKKIGYPELTGGLNDIIPILKKMQEAEPTTADGKKVYGLSPWLADWGFWSFTVYPQGLDNIFAEAGGFVDINCMTNEVTSQIGNTNSTLWQGVKFLYLANQAGVLDPDCVMQKYDQAMDKMNSGRVLMGPTNWSVTGANGTFTKNGELDKGYMPIKLPSNITQVCNLYRNSYTDRWAQGITVKCKAPERAMDLLNFLHSDDGMRLLNNGIEGKDWNVGSDGLPHLTADTLKMMKGTADELVAYGFGGYSHLYGRNPAALDRKYNTSFIYQFNDDPSVLMNSATPFEKDFSDHYGVEYPDQLWEKTLPDQTKVYDGSFMMMIDPITDEIQQIDNSLSNYLLPAITQIITAKDENDYNTQQAAIIEQCKNIGYERAFEWHKSANEAALAKMDAFYAKVGK